MSILIKDMKMPKNCIFCPISHWNKLDELTGCELHQKHIPNAEKEFWEKDRPDWCPLVEVPTPHGRLIDADAMNEKYGDWYTEEGTEEGFIGTLKYLIAEQPIIIEEDGEK